MTAAPRLMRAFTTALIVTLALACGGDGAREASFSAAPSDPPPPPRDTVTPAIPGVVDAGTTVVAIQGGFNGTEGPIALPDGDLIFTETRANRINRISQDGTVSSWMENTNGSNALAWDADGKLYSVQTTPGNMKIGIIYPAGSESVIVDNYQGAPFARPNDLVRGNNGHIYFTDFSIVAAPPEGTLPPAVYHVAPGSNSAMRVADGIARPNGLILSHDERTLFVNDMWGEYMLAFDVQPDGSLTNRRNFARYEGVTTDTSGTTVSGADGLAIDNEGRLYAATTVGIQVFTPDGARAGIIPTGRAPQNLAFAGPGKRTLYVVGSGAAFKVDLKVQGFTGRGK